MRGLAWMQMNEGEQGEEEKEAVKYVDPKAERKSGWPV